MANNNKNDTPENGKGPVDHSRRNLLRNAGLLGAAIAGSTASGTALAAEGEASPTPPIPVREALENLTALEAQTLEAITDRILPADENGPGAREARAVHYIDRSLAGHNAAYQAQYAAGLNALQEYSVRVHGVDFAELEPARQDEILALMEAGELEASLPDAAAFFSLLRDHTIEGTFSDPYYGGNRDFIGWDLLGYPGVRLGTTSEEVARGSALEPTHRSAYDHVTFTKTGHGGQ